MLHARTAPRDDAARRTDAAPVANAHLFLLRARARTRGGSLEVPPHPLGVTMAMAPGSTLLREGLGRVDEAEVVEPKMPTSVDEVKNLSWDELNLVFAMSHASEIRAVVERGDDALRSALEGWTPDERATFARALAEVG